MNQYDTWLEDGVPMMAIMHEGKLVPEKLARIMYTLKHGELAENCDVVQTCGDKTCVNPDHLQIVN